MGVASLGTYDVVEIHALSFIIPTLNRVPCACEGACLCLQCYCCSAQHSHIQDKYVELPTIVHISKTDAVIQNLSVAGVVSISNVIAEENFQCIHSLYMI